MILILLTLLYRQVLEEMEMISAFTAVLHVPNLSKPEHILSVLEESDVFTKQEVASIARNMEGRRYVLIYINPIEWHGFRLDCVSH